MKKLFGMLAMSLLVVLPFGVKAATKVVPSCDENADADGVRNCTIGYVIDSEDGKNELTVTLTEGGGAKIDGDSITSLLDSDWEVDSKDYADNVWTIVMKSINNQSGEDSLFQFKYKESGTEDCKITVKLEDATTTIVPNTPTTDEPTDNKKTGATLPYIALGTIAIVAVGAYLATRNKTKMYKI